MSGCGNDFLQCRLIRTEWGEGNLGGKSLNPTKIKTAIIQQEVRQTQGRKINHQRLQENDNIVYTGNMGQCASFKRGNEKQTKMFRAQNDG